jgi:hypothetical protein
VRGWLGVDALGLGESIECVRLEHPANRPRRRSPSRRRVPPDLRSGRCRGRARERVGVAKLAGRHPSPDEVSAARQKDPRIR